MTRRVTTIRSVFIGLILPLILAPSAVAAALPEFFSVATYNLENYVDSTQSDRPLKSVPSKAQIRESLRTLDADVVALEEIGRTNMLLELRDALAREGLNYPYWEHVTGSDTNIYVAVLSKFPMVARRPHTNENFLLNGRRYHVSRGFAEVDIQVNPKYRFTLLAAHLKSKLASASADEAELREHEAILLREKIDARLTADPNVNLVVLGDFNDFPDTASIRTLIGRRNALTDTRPAERTPGGSPSAAAANSSRTVAWTHYYAKEDTYSRLDYIFLNGGMTREWDREGTYVLALPNWGIGSDHRPIVARFFAENK